MRLTCAPSALVPALKLVASVAPARSNLPILRCLCLRTRPHGLEIAATNLEQALSLVVTDVTVEIPGEIVLDASTLLDIVRALPGDAEMTLSVEDMRATVQTAAGFRAEVNGFGTEEFPELMGLDGDIQMSGIHADDLAALVEATAFAASTDFSRVSLTGCLTEATPDGVMMVSTDGHKLAHAMAEGNGKAFGPCIISTPALAMARKLFPSGGITLSADRVAVRFSQPQCTYTARLIEGPYPAWQNVVPKDFACGAVIERALLAEVTRRAMVMSNHKTGLIQFSFSEDSVTLYARNSDVGGECTETIPVKWTGEPLTIGINGDYLLEVLARLKGSDIRWQFNTPLGATRLESVADANPWFIIMPLRILKENA